MAESGRARVRAAAVIAPIVVAAALSLLRDLVANTSAALVLVLVVLAVGVAGDRVSGLLSALVAAASFDFFLTQPYLQFVILDRDDIETAVLLVAIGIAVTEIAQWGRRHEARSGRREGYLAGVAVAARAAADEESATDVVDLVGRTIATVLDLDGWRFEPAPSGRTDRPRLGRDGSVTWRGGTVDVDRDGLPTMDVIELPAGRGGFLLTASTRVRRPDLEARLVAVTLAEQVGDRGAADAPLRSDHI